MVPIDLISEWLKTTIVGIIILGSTGSIVAILIIKLSKNALMKWLPNGLTLYKKKVYRKGYSHGYAVSSIIHGDNPVIVVGYFAYHSLITIFYLLTCTISIFSFVYFLEKAKALPTLLTYGTYISILLTFISGYFARMEFKLISAFHTSLVKPLLKKGVESHDNKNENEVILEIEAAQKES